MGGGERRNDFNRRKNKPLSGVLGKFNLAIINGSPSLSSLPQFIRFRVLKITQASCRPTFSHQRSFRNCYNSWHAPVAQMDRALVSETKGRTFESSRAYSSGHCRVPYFNLVCRKRDLGTKPSGRGSRQLRELHN